MLLVDDEVDVRESLRDLLETFGYAILEADNGATALQVLQDTPVTPCLVLLDLLMPVMDGFDFLKVVQDRPELSQLSIVITTSAPGRAPPGFDLLPKPVSMPALLGAVRRHCG